jgi:hypothetical protein
MVPEKGINLIWILIRNNEPKYTASFRSGAVPGAAAVAVLAASAGRPPTALCADRVATRGAKPALRGGLRGPAPRGARDNDRIAEVIFSFHPSLSFLSGLIVTCFLFSFRAKGFKF